RHMARSLRLYLVPLHGSRNQESRLLVLKAVVLVPPQGRDSHKKHHRGGTSKLRNNSSKINLTALVPTIPLLPNWLHHLPRMHTNECAAFHRLYQNQLPGMRDGNNATQIPSHTSCGPWLFTVLNSEGSPSYILIEENEPFEKSEESHPPSIKSSQMIVI
ncbi:hypothetical protein STEG23_006885, partial [Scotinomys teguina]